MVLGLSSFGLVHTVLSIVALVSGLVVVAGLMSSRRTSRTTGLFMASALATSVTAFGFPGFGPAQVIGVISLVLLLAAIIARYVFHTSGAWRWIYAVTTTFAVYFLVFVTIAETFKRVPALKAAAPTLTETPFKIAQFIALAVFVVLAALAAKRFRPIGD